MAAPGKVWIEAALNGPWGRERQPGMPIKVEEAGLGVDIRPLLPVAAEQGGHVRVGLEDAPWGSELSNLRWVEQAVRLVRQAGGEPATVTEIRAPLDLQPA